MSDPQFDPDAFLAEPSPGFDPDAYLAESTPALASDAATASSLDSLPSVPDAGSVTQAAPTSEYWPSNNLVMQTPEARATREAENARIKHAFATAQQESPDKRVKTLALANELGLETGMVRAALPDFEQSAAVAKFDPEQWAAENPELKRVLFDHPELAAEVVTNKKAQALTRALAAVGSTVDEGLTWMAQKYKALDPQGAQDLADWAKADAERSKFLPIPNPGEALLRAEAALQTISTADKNVPELDTPEAKAVREAGTAAIMQRRYEEASVGLEVSRLAHQEMWGALHGEDVTDVQSKIHDLEMRRPLKLNDEAGLLGYLSDVATGSPSTVQTMAEAGVTGLAVGTAAGVATSAATKNPTLAMKVAQQGMKVGALFGASKSTFELESGSTFHDSANWVDANGDKLTPQQRAVAAIIAGTLKTGIELAEMSVIVKSFGGTGAALLEANGAESIRLAVARDPRMGALLARAAGQVLKVAVGEGLEEGSQTLTDQGVQTVATGRDAWNMTAVSDDMWMAFKAVPGVAAFGPAVNLGFEVKALQDMKRAEAQVPLVLQLAQEQAVQAAPEAFAKVVSRVTGKSGDQVTSLHVTGTAIQRFFQERSEDPAEQQRQMVEALGPDGPERVATAVATNGKVEIPLAEVNARWGKSEAALALASDTAAQAGHLTPRELADAPKLLEEAKAVADAHLAATAEAQTVSDRAKTIEDQLVTAGRTRSEARIGSSLWRHFMGTLASQFAATTKASALFPEGQVQMAAGDEQSVLQSTPLTPTPNAEFVLADRMTSQDTTTPEGKAARASDFFHDGTTGALNERAWKRIEPTAMQVGSISVEGVKFGNDKMGGHQSGDAVYRAAAQAMAKVPALQNGTLAKVKGDFAAAHLSQEQLDAALEIANQDPVLQGFRLTGTVGPTLREANKSNNEKKATTEKAGQRAGRGEKPLGAPQGDFKLDAKPVTGTAISPDLQQQLDAMHPDDQHREMHRDSTGLLTKDGRDRVLEQHPQKYHVTLDLNLLKAYNDLLGETGGDQLIEVMGKRLVEYGAEEFLGTHVSGDEYTLDSNDEEGLRRFLRTVQADLQSLLIEVKLENGSTAFVPGLSFGVGLAESIDAAEAGLNEHKQQLAAGGQRGRNFDESLVIARNNLARGLAEAGASDRVSPLVGPTGEELAGDGKDAASAEGQVAGAAPADTGTTPSVDRQAAEVEQFRSQLSGVELERFNAAIDERAARGALRAQEAELLFAGTNTAEAISQAREAAGRFEVRQRDGETLEEAQARQQERQAGAEAFLDFVENKSEAPTRRADGSVVHVSDSTWTDIGAWMRDRNIWDPRWGISELVWHSENPGVAPAWATGPVIGNRSGWNDAGMQRRAEAQAQEMKFAIDGMGQSDRRRYQLEDVAANRQPNQQLIARVQEILGEHLMTNGSPSTIQRHGTDETFGVDEVDWNRPDFRNGDVYFYLLQHADNGKPRTRLDAASREMSLTDIVNSIQHPPAGLLHDVELYRRVLQAEETYQEQHDAWFEQENRDPAAEPKPPAQVELPARWYQDTEVRGNVPKGYFETAVDGARRVFKVFFNGSADVSTVLHESAHAWLEMYGDLAERPDAPASVKATYALALKGLGVESRNDITREHHETWARSFEAYMLEGKAPVRDLAKAFARAKAWLVNIYRTVAGIPGAALNDDLRRTFDAMLGADDAVADLRKEQGPDMVTSAKEAGVSEEEWQAHREAQLEAVSEGSRRAELAAVKDAQRVHEKWWKAGLEKLRANFREEYEQQPGRVAQVYLQKHDVVLDRDETQAVIGKARVDGLKTAVDGVRPADLAEQLGFPSADVMLKELVGLKPKDAWVEERAQATMAEMHPSVLEQREKMRALVADGLAGYTERRLLDDQAALRKKDPKLGFAPVEALKRAAKLIVDRTPVGRLTPGIALQQQRSAANAAQKAFAKGEWTKAALANRQALLNAALHRELLQARDERTKLEGLAKALSKTSARERLGKSSPTYLQAVDLLVERLGFRDVEHSADLDAGVLPQAVNQMNGDAVIVGDPDWLEPVAKALRSTNDYKKVDVATARQVRDALEQLRAAARHRTEVLVDGKSVDREEVVANLVAEAQTNKQQAGALPSSESAATLGQRLARFPGLVTAPLLKIETMTDWLGGALKGAQPADSTWYRAFFKPMESARQREADLTKRVTKPIVEALEAIPKSVRRTWMDQIDGAALFPSHQVADGRQALAPPSRRFELLVMALNAGTQSSLDRLTQGRNITEAQLHKALDLLTKDELEWVNAVGRAFESMWPEISAMEERVTGLKPEALERRPMALANGVIDGHYFPAIYDKRVEAAGERQEADAVAAFMDQSYSGFGTQHSHTKGRVEGFIGAIALEPSAIAVHLAQATHDLAFRETIQSVGGLVLDKRIQAALKNALGLERAAQFRQWVQDNGTATGVEGAISAGAFLTFARKLRANTTIAALGYSVPNFFEDMSALPAALFDRELKASYLARGLAVFAQHGLAAIRDVEEQSPTMRAANDQLARDLTHRIGELTAKGPLATGPLAWVKEHAFGLIEASFKATATPIWIGRYQQAIEEGSTQAQAVDLADKTIRRQFPMHSAVNAAGIVRNKGFIGLSLQFFGFFSTANNIILHNAQQFYESPSARLRARAAGRTLGYITAISLVGAFLRGKGPDKEEPPEDWAVRTLGGSMLSMVPFGADLGNMFDAWVRGKPASARPNSALTAVIASLGQAALAAASDQEPSKKIEAAVRAAGPLVGLPTSQAVRTGKYVLDVANGEREVPDPGAAFSGLIYGEADRGALTPFNAPGRAVQAINGQ